LSFFPYGFFRSTSTIAAAAITIAMMMPTTAGMKYWSAADGACVAAGAGVAAAWSTKIAVSACEP
jgi:hypothetical protein